MGSSGLFKKPFILSWIMGILTLAQFICNFFFFIDPGIRLLRIIGWVIWAFSVVFGFLPMLIFRRRGGVAQGKSYMHTTQLVDSGLYAVVRHPQYLAGILLNIALMLISQHWLIIVLGVPAMVLMYIDIQRADQLELEKFGNAYRQYMRRVPQINFIKGFFQLLKR
jgi:protein-S-isoprenylcysteine O-methyltransferase Ste14